MRRALIFLFCWVVLVSAHADQGGPDDLLLVTNAQSGVETISKNDLINLYMGRYRQLPGGVRALPVDLEGIKEQFYRLLLDKNLSEINSYWARLVFSGRATPPLQLFSTADVVEFIANNKGAIGYLYRKDVDSRLKVIHNISERRESS